jgi:cytoskeleton protein RodZ
MGRVGSTTAAPEDAAMDESRDPSLAASAGPLKAAREARGLSLETLAAQLKVPVARLAALEEGRWSDLPDGPYARALAKTVCRSLNLDEAPVLRVLPGVSASSLEQVNTGLNQPFHDPRSVSTPLWRSPWAWGALLVLALGLGLSGWWPHAEQATEAGAASPPAGSVQVDPLGPDAAASVAPTPAPSLLGVPAVPGTASAPGPVAAVAPGAEVGGAAEAASEAAGGASASQPAPPTSGPEAAAGEAPLRVRARQAAWVSVVDGRGQSVFSRLLQPGETVDLAVASPLRVTLGNAPDTEVVWRGQAVDVSANAQQRVARLELR